MRVAVIGGLTLDVNEYHGVVRVGVGGPPHYISRFLSTQGIDVIVVSTVGYDFPEDYLTNLCGSERVECLIKRVGSENVRFRNVYLSRDRRVQYANVIGYRVDIGALTEELRDVDYIIISPVLGEVPIEAVRYIREFSKVAVDPQGFLRVVNVDGRVSPHSVSLDLFLGVDILKVSIDEFWMLDGVREVFRSGGKFDVGIFIVTVGSSGCIVCIGESAYHIPAYPVEESRDPTGAGDVFLGGLVYADLMGYDGLEAAVYASAYTSMFLEGIPYIDNRVLEDRVDYISDGVHEINFYKILSFLEDL